MHGARARTHLALGEDFLGASLDGLDREEVHHHEGRLRAQIRDCCGALGL